MIKKINLLPRYNFCATIEEALSQAKYPFQYTTFPEQFKYTDARFSEYPVVRKLFKKQVDHVHRATHQFVALLNRQPSAKNKSEQLSFIHPILLSRINEYHLFLKNNNIKCKFAIDMDTLSESKGYLQYYGIMPPKSSDFQTNKEHYIHEYSINKDNEKIKFMLKQEYKREEGKDSQAEKQAKREQKLRQDIDELMNDKSFGKKLKDKIFGENQKKKEVPFKIMQTIMNVGSKNMRAKNFQQYVLVDRIDGKMSVEFISEQDSAQYKDIHLTTKWLYIIDSNQPESIRQSRKRVLFDFQLWNRGSFVPIKNYIDE